MGREVLIIFDLFAISPVSCHVPLNENYGDFCSSMYRQEIGIFHLFVLHHNKDTSIGDFRKRKWEIISDFE
jgi:hypothetical protein